MQEKEGKKNLVQGMLARLTSDLDSGVKSSKSPRVETTPKVLRELLTAPNSLMDSLQGIKRAEMSNAIDVYVNGTVGQDTDKDLWKEMFETPPELLNEVERQEWIATLQGVSLSSDAFFPFRDNIDRSHLSGVEFIASPAGSVADDVCIDAANEHNMTMVLTNFRLFHH